MPQNQYLCNVFHGIRFKVNKGWDSAEPLFLCPYVTQATFLVYILQHYLQDKYHFTIFATGYKPL